jgi:hypothetical protein
MVFTGKAAVAVGGGKYKVLKNHHEMALGEDAKAKPTDFVARGVGDDLYNWSSLRSQYLAEANNQIAGEYAGVSGFSPGWYWDPDMWDYTFVSIYPYWSPFGFGFYPPWGWLGGYWGGGFYGGRYWGRRFGGGFGRGYGGGGFGGGRGGGGGGGRR